MSATPARILSRRVSLELHRQRIHIDRHALPGMHPPDLRLFEVRGDPDVIRLGECKQLLPRRDLGCGPAPAYRR